MIFISQLVSRLISFDTLFRMMSLILNYDCYFLLLFFPSRDKQITKRKENKTEQTKKKQKKKNTLKRMKYFELE